MPQLVHKIVWYAALSAASGYAAIRGKRDERLGAGIMFGASALTGYLTSHPGWTAVDSGALIIGATVVAVFGFIALRTDRWWPLWATAFQIISNTALFAPVIDSASRPIAGYFGSVLWDYLTLAALALGTWREAH